MGSMQRNKGKNGERELSKELTALFGVACRRGQQFCGANGDADVVGLTGVHIECKRVEKLDLIEAVAKAVTDAAESDVPAVFHRRNKTAKKKDLTPKERMQGQWLVTVPLSELPRLVRTLYLAMASE